MLKRIATRLKRVLEKPGPMAEMSDREFVIYAYQRILRREPDSEGLKDNIDQLKSGVARLELIGSFFASDEYIGRAARYIPEEFPAGSFVSVIPAVEDIERQRTLDRNPNQITGVDLRSEAQFELLKSLVSFYDEMPYHENNLANYDKANLRYHWDNVSYSPSDAIATYGMMRTYRPTKIIEVGCGNSSCLMLDTYQYFFSKPDNTIDFTLVEPYPDFLTSVLKPDDIEMATIIPKKVQDVSPELFEQLEKNDILFIDSSHVSKAGSDVNYLYLEILPRLKPGVLIHIHDIAYPFEYPQEWLDQGRYWNEQYLLNALLIDNRAFEIELFTTYLIEKHPEWIAENMPRFSQKGGSIWLRRKAASG